MFQQFLNCFKNRSTKDASKEYEKDVLSSVMDIMPNYQTKKGESKEGEIGKQFLQTDNPKVSFDNLTKYDDDNYPYCKFSLDYFALNNKFRGFCIQISQSKLFQWIHSLLSIIIVCVLIVKPYNSKNSGLNITISNDVINGIIILCDLIFSIQVLTSVISFGMWNCKFGYYKDPYAFINSICLIFALFFRQSYLYIFRALYLVNFIIQNKYFLIVKKLSSTVKHVLSVTTYVIIIITLFTYIYATIGVQIWSNQLNNYCVNNGQIDAYPARLCGMGRECPDGYICQNGYFHQPFTQYDYISFDQIPNALLTLFICHFIEGWVEVEQNLGDSFNKFISSIFLWSYIFIGTFFLQNLLVAILLNQYQMDQQIEEIPQIKVVSSSKVRTRNERRRSYFFIPVHLRRSKQRALQIIQNQNKKFAQKSQLRIKLKRIISSNYVKYIYSLLLITNLILFSFNDESAYHNNFENKIAIINFVFLLIYILEDIIRIYVWKQKENKYILLFEFIIDLTSIIVQIIDMSCPFVLNAIKGLRLLWFFKTQTSWSNYKVLLSALQKSFVNIPKLILVFMTYMIVIGILGREYFAGMLHFNEQGNYDRQGSYVPRANFDNIRNTISSLFIIICSDQWEKTNSWIPYPFFIFVLILCRFFILSSFLTIMLDNYEEAKNEAEKFRARAQKVITSMQKTKIVPIGQSQITPTSNEKKNFFGRLSKLSDDSDDEEQESKHHILQRQTSKLPQITVFKSNDEIKVSISANQSNKQYCINSALFILHNKSFLRKKIQQLLQNKYFEWLISSIIVLNLILLGYDLPIIEQKDIVQKLNIAFTIIFIFEILLKILGYAFIWNQNEPQKAFIYNNQNNIDLAVLILSSISDLNLYNSGYLKAFRALRALRLFQSAKRGSQSEELNLISKSLFQTISLLSSMIYVTGICIWILGIFCMTLWKGKLYFCTNVQNYDDIYTKQDCLDQNGSWINNITNFDTIQDSLLCLFRIIIGEGWTSQMFYVSDITERGMHPKVNQSANYQILYFILLFLLNIMILNLLTGLIINNYRTIKENISNYKSLNKYQREWLQMMYIMQKQNLIRLIEKPEHQFRQICYYIATYRYFELIVFVLLLLNLILCSVYSNTIVGTTKQAFYVLDIIFITIFHIEIFIKFSAFWYFYLKDTWNKFDIVLLISTDFLLILDSKIDMPKMFMIPLIIRCLKVLNTYKILKLNRHLKILVDVIQEILPTLLSVVASILIIVIVYALIGIQTLSTVKSTPQDAQYPFYQELDQRNKNFQNFWDAVLILIEVTTGQYWPLYLADYTIDKDGCHSQTKEEILKEGVQGCSNSFGYFYFISFLVLIRIIMISLFLAMIIEQYQECLLENTAVINPYQIEDFFLKWSDYDPKGSGWITPQDFAFLMFEMNSPLGFKDENSQLQLFDFNQNHQKQSAYIYNPRTKMHLKKIDIFKKLSDFQVLIYQNQMIHIKDVCLQIAYNAVKKKNDLQGIEQINDKLVLRKIRKSWEDKFPDLVDQKFLHFAVDIFAISSISNILRSVIERRKVKKRIKEMQKQNNLRQLEINDNAYLTAKNIEEANRHSKQYQIRQRVFPFAKPSNSYRINKQSVDGNDQNRRTGRRSEFKQSQLQKTSQVQSNSLSTHNFYIDPQEMYNGFPMKVVYETQKIDIPSDNSQRREEIFQKECLKKREFQQVHDDINPKIHSRIAPLIFAIKGLKQEINQVFADFIRETNKATDVLRIKDMFEAVLMEYNLREKESNKLLEAILQNDSNQIRQISQLLKEIRELQHEVNQFQRQSEVKRQRQCGIFKGNPTDFKKQNTQIIDETSIYDWVVDIDFITSINSSGWKVWLSPKMINQEIINIKALEGATVAVTGLYDKGKTFVLNSLTMSNLPSGKKVTTRGISFKHVNVDNGTKLILVDTAGTYSPVKIENELSIVDKEATETFISDLVFDLADYFLCVVNDFTSLDQRYLDRLSRNLQQSPNKTFREIIVIHNLKDVESTEILEHVWSTQVTQIYANGTLQKTKVAALNPVNKQLQEKHVLWFKTPYTRHVCIVNDDCNLGKGLNPWVFSLLRYWLKAVFIPVNRSFSVLDCLLIQSRQKLVNFFRKNIKIDLKNTDDPLIKVIKTENEFQDKIQIPQGQIDMSGLITGQQDSFQPATDIIAGDQYIILMDAPGLTNDDVDIQRQNVVTLVKGNKQRPYINQGQLEKSERKYGEFTLTFKIPDIYERQWSYFGVDKGVITIKYDKDKDDI